MVWVVGRPQGNAPTGWAAGEGDLFFGVAVRRRGDVVWRRCVVVGLRENGGWGCGTGVSLAIWEIMDTLKFEKIRSDEEHDAAMARIDEIFDAPVGSAEGDELEVLVRLVEAWEEVRYTIPPPDLMDALEFRMEQEGGLGWGSL